MPDVLSISILVSAIISSLIYALKGTLKDLFSNLLAGIATRGEQISEGIWVEIPGQDSQGIIVGQNLTNVKIDTGEGIKHILNERVYNDNLIVTYDIDLIENKMKHSESKNWTKEARRLMNDDNEEIF